MNNVIFQNQKIWRKDFENGYGYSTSISGKMQDGTYKTAYLTIRFAKSAEAPEKISNGTVADFEGFLTATSTGKVVLVVTKLNIQDDLPTAEDIGVDSFSAAEEDCPF